VKFKIDENLPAEAARLLASWGHQAETVNDEGLCGAPDSELLEVCSRENRVLVTLDLDFGNTRAYSPQRLPRPRGSSAATPGQKTRSLNNS
jgi:predicted nuclease of predicted toxin-antitoxin system